MQDCGWVIREPKVNAIKVLSAHRGHILRYAPLARLVDQTLCAAYLALSVHRPPIRVGILVRANHIFLLVGQERIIVEGGVDVPCAFSRQYLLINPKQRTWVVVKIYRSPCPNLKLSVDVKGNVIALIDKEVIPCRAVNLALGICTEKLNVATIREGINLVGSIPPLCAPTGLCWKN